MSSKDAAGTVWNDLHCRPLKTNGTSPWTEGSNDDAWMREWTKRIPRFTKGCKCNEHWSKWYPQNKPDYKSRDAYFAWTVKAHNAVNARLGKPQVTVEEMKKVYLAKLE